MVPVLAGGNREDLTLSAGTGNVYVSVQGSVLQRLGGCGLRS